MTGAEPVPVPPPIPAVTKTISASPSTSRRRSSSSSAALRPISGLPPVPRPRVNCCPICMPQRRVVVLQRLRIGVDRDEIDVAQSRRDHVINGVAAAAARADHLDPCARIRHFQPTQSFRILLHPHLGELPRSSSMLQPSCAIVQKKSLTQSVTRVRSQPQRPYRASPLLMAAAVRRHAAAARPRSCTSVSSIPRA